MTAAPFTPAQRRTLTVLLIPIFMSLLAVSSINVALPSLQRGIGATDAELQWALSGYTLVFGMVLVPAGRAGDLFGRRRLFLVGLAVYALGGALIAVLGGDLGWRATFLVNVPIALAAMAAARRWLPADAHRPDGGRRADLDPVGVALLAAALVAVMLPFLDRGLGPWRFALLPAGLALLAAWTAWERHHARAGREPMVDLRLFRVPGFGAGAALIGVYFTGSTSIYVVVAMFMQNGLGYPALQAALIGLPSALLASVTAPLAGRAVLRRGRGLVAAGILVALAAIIASMAVIWANREVGLSPWWLLLTLGLAGVGQGMTVSPNQTLTLAQVPPARSGTAGGIIQTGQRVGTAVGSAVIVGLFLAVRQAADWDTAVVAAFGLIAAVMLVALGIAAWDLRRGRVRG